MNGIERVRAAIAGAAPDRAPIGAWGHSFRNEWDASALADYTVRRARKFGWDYVKLQPRATCFAEALGAEYEPDPSGANSPVCVKPKVDSLQDWLALPMVDASHPALAQQTEALRIVVGELGGEVPVIQTVFSPLSVGGYLVGKDKEKVVAGLRANGDDVRPALERISMMLITFIEASINAGASGIFYAISGYAADGMMSEKEYRHIALKYDQQILAALSDRSWFNVLHLCGDGVPLGLAKDLPVNVVSWSVHGRGNPSLSAGHAATQIAVMGGVDQVETMLNGSEIDVARQVTQANETMDGNSLLIAPGCSVPPEVSDEMLLAMSHALD